VAHCMSASTTPLSCAIADPGLTLIFPPPDTPAWPSLALEMLSGVALRGRCELDVINSES